ncbi:hypothetical protein ES705_50216 [subsurface metagenome]
MPEAHALLNDSFVHSLFCRVQHVVESELALPDLLRQGFNLHVGPTQLPQQRFVPVERPGLGVLGNTPDLALKLDAVPQIVNQVGKLGVIADHVIQGYDTAPFGLGADELMACEPYVGRLSGVRSQNELRDKVAPVHVVLDDLRL